jgi:hypothetical protein
MSDPAKSADEIEDVLASIRRLVSETGAPAPRPAASGKLVLTPAHRVSEPDDPWAPVTPATPDTSDATARLPAEAEGEDPAWGLEDRLSDWGEIEGSAEEAVADAMAEDEAGGASRPFGSDQAEGPFELGGPAASGTDGDVEDAIAEAFEPEVGDVDWPDRGADSALRDLAAARSGQQAASAVPGVTEGAEPSAGAPGAAPLAEIADRAAEEGGEVAPPLEAPVDGEDDTTPEPEMDMSDPVTSDPEAQTGPEPVVMKVFSRPTSSSARADTGPSAEMRGQDDTGDDGEEGEIEDFGNGPSPFTFPDTEEGILDEETLREIVAEVVRAELQGALGQRITRNVRKMVRREIRIALAAEDLE